ncbi:MAG: ComEC family competence protein [Bacteroidetes bacterium]|nr:MAG: ComEC family competence protein [Bacteroidota bacterium]MBL1144537.1 ComEC family competence protein [Bacteroidota bacterium]NOG57332.1 DUF4131 domain-containing protein [Bacteroidota bacterium]
MFYWSQIPLVKIVIPFCLGIILHQYLPSFYFQQLDFLFVAIGFVFILYFHTDIFQKYKFRFHFGIILFIAFIFFGFKIHEHYNQDIHVVKEYDSKQVKWLGKINEIVKNDGETALLHTDFVVIGDSLALKQKAQVWVRNPYENIQIGDSIIGFSKFSKISEPQIPNQFNYSSFLANRKVYLQCFTDSIILISSHENIFSYATSMRNKIIFLYKEMGIKDQNLAVLIALTLGEKQFLDSETKSTFADAGAMHILAVSGLHVGIVFLILQTLLSFLQKLKFGAIIKAIMLLLGIWCFALLTGLSPSVQRAACMFSILAIGGALNRSTNIINSISASAFIILLINPNAIFEVGFQLSYSAVIGIVLFHPILQHLFPVHNKWLKKITALLFVSFAAQIATLPFTLYYFHQFPNWFWLINLGVIPIAFIIVGLSVSTLLVFIIFSKTFGLSILLNGTLYALNYLVELSQILPFSTTSGIWIDIFSAILIFALIFTLTLHLYFPSSFKIGIVLAISIVLSIKGISWNQNRNNQQYFAAYPFGNNVIIANINGQNAELYYLKDTLTPFQSMQVESHLLSIGVKSIHKQINTQNRKRDYNVLSLNNKLIYYGDLKYVLSKKPLPFDVFFITSNQSYVPICEIGESMKNIFYLPYLLYYDENQNCDLPPNVLNRFMGFTY